MGSALDSVHCSGLIVELATVDPVVAPFRAALDPMVRLGVPPHVTVLFPFVTGQISTDVIAALTALFADTEPFEVTFSDTAWFGDDVLWLAPDDPAPFIHLTERTVAAFPEYPPYGGEFEEITPHLTVGDRADPLAMREAETDLAARLPITARADAVTLMTQVQPGGPWTRAAYLPIGPR